MTVEPGVIVGLYTRLEAAVVVVAFEARVASGTFRTNPEALEIVAYMPAAIPWRDIAFTTSLWALRDWIALRHPELHAAALAADPR